MYLMEINFIVYGIPQSKFSKVDDIAWHILFRNEFDKTLKDKNCSYLYPQEVNLKFFFYDKNPLLLDRPHNKKPDIDNCLKNVLDIMYHYQREAPSFITKGDQSVWKVSAEKRFTDCESYTEITVKGIEMIQ
jgi:Holliday junction resolvase RusA-like endonuclease